MARTIRLAGAGDGAAGLSTSEVTSLIQSNSSFVLDKNYLFTSGQSAPLTVIPDVDFDNVAVYLIVGRGLTKSSGNDYRAIKFGSANGVRSYYGNRGSTWYSGSQNNYNNGIFNLMPNNVDVTADGINEFQLKIFINEKDAPNNGRRRAKIHYTTEIPNEGGYQNYAANVHFHLKANDDWSDIAIALNSGSDFTISQYVKNASITVYKQLRVPAS